MADRHNLAGQAAMSAGLAEDLITVIESYAGAMTLSTALGVMEMVKFQLIYQQAVEDDEEEDE